MTPENILLTYTNKLTLMMVVEQVSSIWPQCDEERDSGLLCLRPHTQRFSWYLLYHSQDCTVFGSYIICIFKVTLSEKSHQIIKDAFNGGMFL